MIAEAAITRGACDTAHFHQALAAGVPVSIPDCHGALQGEWEPEAFSRKYGYMKVSPINCLTGEEVGGEWYAAMFFDLLVRGDGSQGPLKLKVCRAPRV